MELSPCNVFQESLAIFSGQREEDCPFPNETDECRCVSQPFCHYPLPNVKLFKIFSPWMGTIAQGVGRPWLVGGDGV